MGDKSLRLKKIALQRERMQKLPVSPVSTVKTREKVDLNISRIKKVSPKNVPHLEISSLLQTY